MKISNLAITLLLSYGSQGLAETTVPDVSNRNEKNIVGIPEFLAHSPNWDGFYMWFSSRSTIPDATTFEIWGLEITDDQAFREFMADRVVRCFPLFRHQGKTYVDCDAAPWRGKEWVVRGTNEEWLNLYAWLPEFGFAVNDCDAGEMDNEVEAHNHDFGYYCRTGMPVRERILYEYSGEPY